MVSIWEQTAPLPPFPALAGDRKVQAAVIGGGMAGILTAWFLQQAGTEVLILEADRVGRGQTAGTTAKLTAQHGLIYHRLLEQFGAEQAGQYARANLRAVEDYRRLIRERRIDCALEDCTAYLYTTGDAAALVREYESARQLGIDAFLTEDTELPFPAAALGFRHQARFHPLRFLGALAGELDICEHTRVLTVEGQEVRTDRGTVTAEAVIFACHYPFLNAPGYFFARQHQERSYVLALEGPKYLRDVYLGVDGDGLSLRSWDRYLLLGGGTHRTGENRQGGQYASLRAAARRYWPGCTEAAFWSAQDCMPVDGVPYIGPVSPSRPRWLAATGFQKWGMTSSMAAARILTDLALGKNPADAQVFSPLRFKAAASARQLAGEMGHAVRGLGRRLLEPGRIPAAELPAGHGGVVELDGEKLGVYRDEKGRLWAVEVRCPHLGCQLEWNPEERSWDCPCHGSRFDHRGRLMDGPAQTHLAAEEVR